VTHDDNLLAEWLKHPGAQVAISRVNAEVERRVSALATLIIATNAPIDQRKVDEERGFKKGALWFLTEAKRGQKAFERSKQGGETV
jgi:hypothetical protein